MLFTSVGGIPTRKKWARCEHPTMGLKDTLICLTSLIPLSVPVLTDVKGVCARYAACYAVINKCHNTPMLWRKSSKMSTDVRYQLVHVAWSSGIHNRDYSHSYYLISLASAGLLLCSRAVSTEPTCTIFQISPSYVCLWASFSIWFSPVFNECNQPSNWNDFWLSS